MVCAWDLNLRLQMVGADDTTELWRPKDNLAKGNIRISFLSCSIQVFNLE